MPLPRKPQPRLVDNRNRIALTADALAALGVEAGDHVLLEIEGDAIRIRRVTWSVS